MTAKHLIDLGHRRLLFAHIDERTLRWRGCQRAIAEARRAGESVQVSAVSGEDLDAWLRTPEQAAGILAGADAPTGILAWNDHEAAKLAVVLGRNGVKFPDDVSLIGYDALPEGDLVYPPLTTVDQQMDRQLRAALDLLTQAQPPESTHTIVVLPSLIVRGSCAATSVPKASASLIFTES